MALDPGFFVFEGRAQPFEPRRLSPSRMAVPVNNLKIGDKEILLPGSDKQALMKQPAFRAKMTEIGLDPVGSTPEEFDAYIKTEITKWTPIVKASGAKPD